MVVLAASIVNRSGKPLVSRQYAEMTRIRIEGLLAAFPKLIGTGKAHTYVETDAVRYVYQPIESLYLVLITNKTSNIVEDLECLRLLSKVVPDFAEIPDEEHVTTRAFELIFAFDEVISMGLKETITVAQVRQNTEMDSHEEKLHKMIIQSKIQDTKEAMKKRAQEIEKQRVARPAGISSVSSGGPAQLNPANMGMGVTNMPSSQAARPSAPSGPQLGLGGSMNAPKATGPAKGMSLGGKKTTLIDSLRAEGEVVETTPLLPQSAGGAPLAPAAPARPVSSDPVFIGVEEKVTAALSKDGGVESLEINGQMTLEVRDSSAACLIIKLSQGDTSGFQFKTHPNIDKGLYTNQGTLGLKDASRPFPTGTALGVLKWRCVSRDEERVPLVINCWPSISGQETTVNIEYESPGLCDLANVVVQIPLPQLSQPPRVTQADGSHRWESRRNVMVWQIDLIDEMNRTGSMEFVVPAVDPDTFFPIQVGFTSSQTLCDVSVESVLSSQGQAPVKYDIDTVLRTEAYVIE